MTEEPDEGNLHVRVCGGSAGQPVLLPGTPYGVNSLFGGVVSLDVAKREK